MRLVNGDETLTLKFDCKRCEMHVIGALRPHVAKMRDTVVAHKVSFAAQCVAN